jgi:hypothetical protein
MSQVHAKPGPALSENDDLLLVEGPPAGGFRTAELPPNGEGRGARATPGRSARGRCASVISDGVGPQSPLRAGNSKES